MKGLSHGLRDCGGEGGDSEELGSRDIGPSRLQSLSYQVTLDSPPYGS